MTNAFTKPAISFPEAPKHDADHKEWAAYIRTCCALRGLEITPRLEQILGTMEGKR